jgi:hypothetical protein
VKRHDVALNGTRKHKLNKKELEKQLVEKGIKAKGTSKRLQQLCNQSGREQVY